MTTNKTDVTKTKEYKDWRAKVLELNGQLCAECGSFENLYAHHILPKSKFHKYIYVVENGVALCKSCHREAHKYGTWFTKHLENRISDGNNDRINEMIRLHKENILSNCEDNGWYNGFDMYDVYPASFMLKRGLKNDYIKINHKFFSHCDLYELEKKYGAIGLIIYIYLLASIAHENKMYSNLYKFAHESVAHTLKIDIDTAKDIVEYLVEIDLITLCGKDNDCYYSKEYDEQVGFNREFKPPC